MVDSLMQYWQLIATLAGVVTTIMTPTVWIFRLYMKKVQQSNDQLFQMVQNNGQDGYDKLSKDLESFYQHFDTSINRIYESIKDNDRSLRDHMTEQINTIKGFLTELETRIEAAREHNHRTERDLLQFKNEAGEKFVTHSEMDRLVDVVERQNKKIKTQSDNNGEA